MYSWLVIWNSRIRISWYLPHTRTSEEKFRKNTTPVQGFVQSATLFVASNPVSFSAYLYSSSNVSLQSFYFVALLSPLSLWPPYHRNFCSSRCWLNFLPLAFHSYLYPMNRSHLSILRRFDRSLTNQQIENYHVTMLLVLLRCFELSTPDMYDSVRTPLVCTRERVNFELFARFVQIIRVCGRTFNVLTLPCR